MPKAIPQKNVVRNYAGTITNNNAPVLEPHLDRVVEMKMAGAADRQIAAELGVDHTTVSRFLRKPSVRKEIDRAHGELMKRASRQLSLGAGWAVETLLHYVNPDNRDKVEPRFQLQATKIMMDTIGLGRMADATELLGEAITDTVAESARAKVLAIEASFVEAEERADLHAVNE
jgi:hypothetical protein